jgi:hypothetical protein
MMGSWHESPAGWIAVPYFCGCAMMRTRALLLLSWCAMYDLWVGSISSVLYNMFIRYYLPRVSGLLHLNWNGMQCQIRLQQSILLDMSHRQQDVDLSWRLHISDAAFAAIVSWGSFPRSSRRTISASSITITNQYLRNRHQLPGKNRRRDGEKEPRANESALDGRHKHPGANYAC